MTTPNIAIHLVEVEKILDLRHRILRAGLPPEYARFEGDHAATTLHWAAYAADASGRAEGPAVGCLSLMLNSFQEQPAWQVRGMAVDGAHQGRGLGRQLLALAEQAAAADGRAGLLWCNARVPASGFYEKQGWAVMSDVFEIPTAGPHVKMRKNLICANRHESIENPPGQR